METRPEVPLQDQPFKVLALLLQRPGDLVTREELQRALWPSDTFGEFDEGLNKAVQKLRQALDDSTDKPQFIETLPRKGYRFIAVVESAAEGAVAQLAHEVPAKGNREILPWVLFAVACFFALVLGIAHLRQTPSESHAVRLQVSVQNRCPCDCDDPAARRRRTAPRCPRRAVAADGELLRLLHVAVGLPLLLPKSHRSRLR